MFKMNLTKNSTPNKSVQTLDSFKDPTTKQSKTHIGKKALCNLITPVQDLPSGSRFVSRPVLVSQMDSTPPSMAASQDNLWGKEADDELLVVASEDVEKVGVNKPFVDELEALTMACVDEDDFDIDDIDTEDVGNRLHQTKAVFKQVENNKENNPVDQKEAQIGKLKKQVKVLEEENEKFKNESFRAQGEVTYLRTELTEKSIELETERRSRIQMEKKAKVEAEINEENRQGALAEKTSMLQEMDDLRSRLRKAEKNVGHGSLLMEKESDNSFEELKLEGTGVTVDLGTSTSSAVLFADDKGQKHKTEIIEDDKKIDPVIDMILDQSEVRPVMTPFACFLQVCRLEYKKNFPEEEILKVEDIHQSCNDRWKIMTEADKKRFNQMVESDRRRYRAEIKGKKVSQKKANK